MTKNFYASLYGLLVAICMCFCPADVMAVTEVHVEKAGTLSSLLTSTDKQLKLSGSINGTDIKFIRELISAGTVISLDLDAVRIVAGGEAYTGSFTTEDNAIGEEMFYGLSKLQTIVLPSTITSIKKNAFAKTGIKKVDIPNSVYSLGEDAFAYSKSLASAVIGKRVKSMSKGVFYGCDALKKVYVKPLTPPSISSYLFNSKPTIYVYKEALTDYKTSGWKEYYGIIYGTLATYYPQEQDENDVARELCSTFFEDAACTQLKAEYQAMTDEQLSQSMAEAGMPTGIIDIALKVKNQTWAEYEQEFRIHNYKAYSDANYWIEKLFIESGSYMGNPTGIYTKNDAEPLYVFVGDDVPEDATLYMACLGVNKMFNTGKAGQKLQKGLNVVEGEAGKYFYILYTADTKSMTKRVEEWPELKIHIEGGTLDGYFDASRHTDADYKKLLAAATYETFVIKGTYSVQNLKTSLLRETFPSKIHKASECMDSLYVWENDLSGVSESVANGEKAGAPWYLTGGEAYFPGYFNNPAYIDNDSEGVYAHANRYGTHYSLGASKYCLNPYISDYDEGGTSHELGHQHQKTIKLEGTEEGSNDLFANVNRFFVGHRASTGRPLSVTMQEFANRVPFSWRGPDKATLRMYYSLYLYYHQAQKNTSFYPELFKALRNDPLSIYESNSNNSLLKFVRKVCEVAQEDLTDFFTVYGFFEPTNKRYLEAYGDHYVTTRQEDIDNTKAVIAQYPVKNREIIFIEDRVDYVPTTGFVTTAGQHRKYRNEEQVGMCGDVGQYTDYLPGACEPSSYTYLRSDSLYALEGKGGLGFLMLDGEGDIKYAANAKNFFIPTNVERDFTIYSLDADGSLHEVPYAGSGTQSVELSMAGKLEATLEDANVIKLIVKGRIHGKDIKYMRKLLTEGNLQVLDLENAQIVANTTYSYYKTYKTSKDVMGDYAFEGFLNLVDIKLPQTITKIGTWAFSRTGIHKLVVPDKVTSIGSDAFSYCDNLTTVVLGKGMKTVSSGAFYSTKVKDIYAMPLTHPSISGYQFSGDHKPTLHVYASALEDYQASTWAEYCTIVGDLTDDIIDSIEEISSVEETKHEPVIYDLLGRKVTKTQPGNIYICDGKKIVK
jgi:hypothetical protein